MPHATMPKVNASEVTYELHTLGWKAFQNLCTTIASEIFGQTVQSFATTRDGGRDGAFYGMWQSKEGDHLQGSFTCQCKFTAQYDECINVSSLNDELIKARRLAARGLADNYLLFTNARLTGDNDTAICQAFLAIPGIKSFKAYGCERISIIIQESPRLRMLVPRVYGLGDLSQILDERVYAQAKEILSLMGDDLRKFVITDAYNKSARAITDHGFVLLLGEPACGKSTIAASLAIGALDRWGCSTICIRNADDFIKHSNPNDPQQFFWVDDAFGSTQFDLSSAEGWNRVFSHVHAAISRGAKVLFTSRSYIYNYAKQRLKESALPIIKDSQVVIHVEQLKDNEREQILYNHIKLGTQPTSFKSKIKPHLALLAAHDRFSPEIARRLGDPVFTKSLILSKNTLVGFVERSAGILLDVIRNLDAGSRSALALVFMRGGLLESPITMTTEEEKAIALLGGNVAAVTRGLGALEGSLVVRPLKNGRYYWHFKHPTVRDAFAALIAENVELMDIYLAGTPVEKLLSEVSCGDVGLQGVNVVIPPSRYEAFKLRIHAFELNGASERNSLHRFLAYRCDRRFLEYYIECHPNFINGLKVGSFLNAVSDVSLIARLHELGLLPNQKRERVVVHIANLAVDTPDSGFLDLPVCNILTHEETDAILEKVRVDLLPNLEECIDNWKSDYRSSFDDDPCGFFNGLSETLEEYREHFGDNWIALMQIDNALAQIEDVISYLMVDSYKSDSRDPGDEKERALEPHPTEVRRSIFDDVDL